MEGAAPVRDIQTGVELNEDGRCVLGSGKPKDVYELCQQVINYAESLRSTLNTANEIIEQMKRHIELQNQLIAVLKSKETNLRQWIAARN